MNIQRATHVLIATDGSTRARAAANFLRTLFPPRSVHRITVLAVVRPLATAPFVGIAQAAGAPLLPQESWETLNQATQHAATVAMQEIVTIIHDVALRVDVMIRSGSPAEEIIRAARAVDANLIVLGSRGSGEMRSVLLGSVSERVLHHADCPVLIVRPTKAIAT